jgi:hypothetical protein
VVVLAAASRTIKGFSSEGYYIDDDRWLDDCILSVAIENTDPESENLSKVLTSLSIPVAEIL